MDTERICPGCKKPVAADAPQGLCPECLMKAGFGSTAGQAGDTGFVPPPIETVAELFPQLEILEFIGKGGMGAVYKARQSGLDRLVALKILPPRPGPDPGFAERFTREARALARLSHPNIVAVYDFGQVDGLHYFLMEYVDGLNLRQIEEAGRLTPAEALRIIPQICEALQFAHEEGIVHRDIKPENVLLDKKGRVKIADFGLAKILGREPTHQRLTGARDVMGTPHYMAPEQVERPRDVDHRADIYSLGVVFYEMLTGELPLGRFAPPSQKAQIDVRLDEVVLRTLEKEPERRYQHASQVKTDVETISAGSGGARSTSTQTPGPVQQQVKWPAIGLVAAGILNWLALPLIFYFLLRRFEFHPSFLPPGLSQLGFMLVLVAPFVLCTFIMFAALKMMRLEAYRAAIVASIVAMVVTPGNIIGLPAGIWALITLARPEIREAFRRPPPSKARVWKQLWITAAVTVLFAMVAGIGLRILRHSGARQPVAVLFTKNFTLADAPISRDLNAGENESWSASCVTTQTFRLFEVPVDGLEQCVVTYQANLKSEGLDGRAYLEMWCHFPSGGEFFSRGLDNVISGSNDWAAFQTPFFLKPGEKPDLFKLNLVVEGAGKVFIKDVQLTATADY
jgi:predicted Ser/Thr protein kinase